MYLWRNLPEGQLVAVLRWMQARREAARAAAGKPAEPLAGEPGEPAVPARR